MPNTQSNKHNPRTPQSPPKSPPKPRIHKRATSNLEKDGSKKSKQDEDNKECSQNEKVNSK